jgi:hypothetical protein
MQSKGPANLNSSLLARKGQAIPSPNGRYASVPATFPREVANSNEPAARRVAPDDYHDATHDDADDSLSPKRPVGDGPRVAMTVRLDHDTHRRLRLLSAHTNKSSQEIFTEALESYMKRASAKIPGDGCACLSNSPPTD